MIPISKTERKLLCKEIPAATIVPTRHRQYVVATPAVMEALNKIRYTRPFPVYYSKRKRA